MKRVFCKKFKKSLSVVLVVAMLFTTLFSASVFAASDSETTATVETTGLTVNATSNYFPANSAYVDDNEEYVTVTYMIDSTKDMLNCQWQLNYDPSVLEFDKAVNTDSITKRSSLMPAVNNLSWNNISEEGKIKANATSIYLYSFANKGLCPFVTVTFKVIGSGETTVELLVDVLTLSLADSETMTTDANEETVVVDRGVVNEVSPNPVNALDTVVYAGVQELPTKATTVPETTVPETTVPETTEPESIFVVLGDVDFSGKVDVKDSSSIMQYIAEMKELPNESLQAADVDGDGFVTILDATVIQKHLAKLVENTNIGTQKKL